MKKISKVLRVIIINCLIVCFLLVVIELSTRTFSSIQGKGFFLSLHERPSYDQKIEGIYQWHPFVGIIHKPNSFIAGGHPNQKEKVTLFTDKNGFLVKSPEEGINLKKNKDVIRIAVIGASTTANINLSYDDNWPGHLTGLIQERFPGKKVELINAAVSGFDTAQSIGNLALRVMPFKPDVVIIYHAYNDLKAIRKDIEFKPDYSHIHTAPHGYYKKPGAFVQLLNKSMTYVRIKNEKQRIRNESELESTTYVYSEILETRLSHVPDLAAKTFKGHLASLIAVAQAGDAKVILSSFATLHDPKEDWITLENYPNLSDFQKMALGDLLYFTPGLSLEGVLKGISIYNKIIKEMAEEKNAEFVDNAKLIAHADENFVDRVHFSKVGSHKMAENFFPVVLNLLNE